MDLFPKKSSSFFWNAKIKNITALIETIAPTIVRCFFLPKTFSVTGIPKKSKYSSFSIENPEEKKDFYNKYWVLFFLLKV